MGNKEVKLRSLVGFMTWQNGLGYFVFYLNRDDTAWMLSISLFLSDKIILTLGTYLWIRFLCLATHLFSLGLWKELMGFMYVQVAQQHRDIMREILGTRRKTKGSGMTTRDVFGKWKGFPQRMYLRLTYRLYLQSTGSASIKSIWYNLYTFYSIEDKSPKDIYNVHPQMQLNLLLCSIASGW